MSEKFDIVIIGTGCGGAAAAALASYHGLKTLVLEKNKIIGGRCSTHEIRGFKMDHGHIVGQSDQGPHGEVLRRVKCEEFIPEYALANFLSQKVIIMGNTLSFPENYWKTWRLFKMLKVVRQLNIPWREYPGIGRLMLRIGIMSEKKKKQLDRVDVKTFVSGYTDNQYMHNMFGGLAGVCFGALPEEASTGELLRTFMDAARNNCAGYPITGEGIAAIPQSFLNAAEKLGAEVRTSASVSKIVVEDNQVKGLEVDGQMIETGFIISNAGINETVLGLVGEDKFDNKFTEHIKNLKYSFGGISLKYAIDKKVVDFQLGAKIPDDLDQHLSDVLSGKIPETMSMMLVCTSNIDKTLAPEGKQNLLIISPAPAAEPGTMKWEKWVDRLKEEVEDFVPGLKENTLFCVASTPDVIAAEAGRKYGDAVGVAQTIDQMGDKAPSSILPVKGLYCVGADIGSSGIATEMATQSALDLFDYLEKNNKFKK